MRKKLFIAGLVLLPVLSGIAFALVWPSHTAPYYQGRSLSWWLRDYHAALTRNWPPSAPDPRELRDKQAIAAMGTNAVPLLLSWIASQEKPNLLRTRYNYLCAKFPRLGLPYWPAPSKNKMAYEGFYALGREATETVRPALIALTTNVPSGSSMFSLTNTTPAAFWAGGVLFALDFANPRGGFDVCAVTPPLVFPQSQVSAPASYQPNLRFQNVPFSDPNNPAPAAYGAPATGVKQ